MTRFFFVLIISVLVSASMTAYADVTVVDTIDCPAAQLRYHLRVRPDGGDAHSWGVEWRSQADSSLCYITVSTEAEISADPAYGYYTEIKAGRRSSCGDTVVGRMHVFLKAAPSQTGSSLIIQTLNDRTVIKIGSERVVLTETIDLPLVGQTAVTGHLKGRGDILRHTLSLTPAADIQMMSFAGTDQLYDYLRRSRDQYEGIWKYYDRNNDPLRSRLGGRYTFAIVSAGEGTYNIIYLAGADENLSAWSTGRVKGTLYPATFPGVFDMQWIQPDGVALTNDVGALFEGDVLSLLFPLWRTTVRLRRLKIPG